MKTLRIFISSPSDVRSERVRAYDVVQRLQTKYRAFIKIEAILWEDEPMRATATFQAQIPKPSETDVVICVLWARIGTRLPQDYKRPDGTVPTGTEWEFEDAYASFQLRGTPDLLVYRKIAPPSIVVTSQQMLEEWIRQKQALDAFVERWLHDHEGGFRAAFTSFNTDDEFEKVLTEHLDKVISRRMEAKAPITWTEGSPFRGLEVFEPQHEKIFFGRDLAIAEITGRLIEQSQRGRVFLMILGMSGCGKSSLVRAGVLPELMRPGVVAGVGCWRWAILRPGESSGTLLDGLAGALTGDRALPELVQLGYSAEKLSACLREAPTHAVPLIEAALGQAAKKYAQETLRGQAPEARLILVVDQMEEAFTNERFDLAQRVASTQALTALSRSGLVWVIATVRSDLYHYYTESEAFRALRGDDGQYDLSPPTVSEIGQLIRLPAQAAGLEFEPHPKTHQRLDDALQEEAARNPHALPLLEFCLDELYKRRTPAHLVTWAAYEELGGLKGAIARRAEDVLASLSPAGRQAFPRVLAALVTMEATATARLARRKDLLAQPGAEELVNAFAKASLFIADVDQAGEPVVSVAHEALITSWPRVQEWVQENKDFLRLKTRLAQGAHRWREAGKHPDFLLHEGKPLAEALDALRKRRAELDEVEFIEASARHAAHRRRLHRSAWAAVAVVILGLIFGSVWKQRNDALRAQAEAQHTASKTDYTFAADEMARGNIPVSLAYLADALRDDPTNQGAMALALAEMRDSPLPQVSVLHGDEVQDAEFSPDGTRFVTASADGSARIWDVAAGKEIGPALQAAGVGAGKDAPKIWVHAAEFSPDGQLIVTASWDSYARLWDVATGREMGAPLPHGGQVVTARFSPDGTRVVTACFDGMARVWDVRTGRQICATPKQGGIVWTAYFSPDGRRILTASADHHARVWDALTGAEIGGGMEHGNEVNMAVFSPDGRWIATASDDGRAQIWDAATLKAAGAAMENPDSTMRKPINYVSFSPDSRTLATTSSDQYAYLWEVPSGRPVGHPLPHAGVVRSIKFSPNGRWVVTSSYDRTARVWDAHTGAPLSGPLRHSGAVYMATFSPDDTLIATASFDHTARLWAWHQLRELPAITLPLGAGAKLTRMALSADGQRLLTVTEQVAQIWDAKSGARLGSPLTPANPGDKMLEAYFSPDGSEVLTVSTGGLGRWDTLTGARRAPGAFRPDGTVTCARFSPDGQVIATGTVDGTARVWNARTGEPIGAAMLHNGNVASVAFSRDGRWLVTASADHRARTWNAQTGAAVATMRTDSWVIAAEFSPDGRWVVTAGLGGTAQVWDAQTGLAVSQVMRHGGPVVTASFSPNGQWVLTASSDRTAQLWEARTGVAASLPLRQDSPLAGARFSADGQWVLTAAEDGVVRTWEAPFVSPQAPAWLNELAEDVGGMSLDAKGVLQPTSRGAAGLHENLGRLTGTDDVARFGRWFAADPDSRPLSPRGD
ncbi:MAG TPA: hypothetical protein VMD31_01260 [Opitutaceae bacterium]|nr:hypothetical protein [Opitutaceae bacterium]